MGDGIASEEINRLLNITVSQITQIIAGRIGFKRR